MEGCLRSDCPEELFDPSGRLCSELAGLAPKSERRMSANGGLLLRELHLPDFRDYAVQVPGPGAVSGEATASRVNSSAM